jgi:hypothetical protein
MPVGIAALFGAAYVSAEAFNVFVFFVVCILIA